METADTGIVGVPVDHNTVLDSSATADAQDISATEHNEILPNQDFSESTEVCSVMYQVATVIENE